jgi:hypothetical protein
VNDQISVIKNYQHVPSISMLKVASDLRCEMEKLAKRITALEEKSDEGSVDSNSVIPGGKQPVIVYHETVSPVRPMFSAY